MNDKQQAKILQEFINDHSVSIGGDLRIELTQFHTSIKPVDGHSPAKYEDAVYISDILKGAEQFCYWLRRKNYNICHKKT